MSQLKSSRNKVSPTQLKLRINDSFPLSIEQEEIEDLVGKRKREDDEQASSSTSKPSKRAKRSRNDQDSKDKDKNNEDDEKEDRTIDYQAKAVPFDSYSINLWDEKFMKDKSPLVRKLHFLLFSLYQVSLL